MIRGVLQHFWEAPGTSCIVLQLNLDRHEEIFNLPSGAVSHQSSKKKKNTADTHSPIVVKVSVSSHSYDEMPSSIQLWQARGTDERSLQERHTILPRVEAFSNSFTVVTVLFRELPFLLVGMSGNVKKSMASSPCRHNVIVCVEPVTSVSTASSTNPTGVDVHPMTNLNSPAPAGTMSTPASHDPPPMPTPTPSHLLEKQNQYYHNQLQSHHPQTPLSPHSHRHLENHVHSSYSPPSSAFSPVAASSNHHLPSSKQYEPVYPPAAREAVKAANNFFHTSSSSSSPSLVGTSGQPISYEANSPTASTTTSHAIRGVIIPSNNEQEAAEKKRRISKEEDTTALHYRRFDHSNSQGGGFHSPAIPQEIKFRSPGGGDGDNNNVEQSKVQQRADSYQQQHTAQSSMAQNLEKLRNQQQQQQQRIVLKETETQTSLPVSPVVGGDDEMMMRMKNSNQQQQQRLTASETPPPPPPSYTPSPMSATGFSTPPPPEKKTASDFVNLSIPQSVDFFISNRFQEFSEACEELSLTFTIRQQKLWKKSFEAVSLKWPLRSGGGGGGGAATLSV